MIARHTKPAAIGNRAFRSGALGSTTPAGGAPTAQAHYERYLALAKARALAGDRIEAERCYQYAEHYLRLIKGTAA